MLNSGSTYTDVSSIQSGNNSGRALTDSQQDKAFSHLMTTLSTHQVSEFVESLKIG